MSTKEFIVLLNVALHALFWCLNVARLQKKL